MRSTPRPHGEEQREYAPAHAVIEVIDQPRLGGGEQIAGAERGQREDLAEADRGGMAVKVMVAPRLAISVFLLLL